MRLILRTRHDVIIIGLEEKVIPPFQHGYNYELLEEMITKRHQLSIILLIISSLQDYVTLVKQCNFLLAWYLIMIAKTHQLFSD